MWPAQVTWTLCWVTVVCCVLMTPLGVGAKVKPPAYILDMYDQFVRNGSADGNTVHALLPLQGLIQGDSMVVFNLSGIHSHERLRSAQLHVHRRVMAGRLRSGSLRMRICQISLDRVPVLEDIVLNLNSSGWQAFDVTAAVQRVLESRQQYHLLGVRVELKRPGRAAYRLLRWRRVRRLHLQPFVIAFADDDSSMEEDLERNFLHAPAAARLAAAATPGGDLEGAAAVLPSGGDVGSAAYRVRRSVVDNRTPAGDDEGYFRYEVAGVDHNDISVFMHHGETSALAEVTSTTEADPSLIPYPSKQKQRKWRRRKHKKRKHRKRKMLKNRQLPAKWNITKTNATKRRRPRLERPAAGCRRHRLTIDFDAIGWGDWIISPNRFDAYYCDGVCQQPLIKESRPTNHATIQSLAAMLGFSVDGPGSGPVPLPCCVPDALDSLTLLFFDDTGENVVLRSYQNMVVKSCSCR